MDLWSTYPVFKFILGQTKPKTFFECLRKIFDCKKVAIGILVGIAES
jgi:hypothetical protein